MKVGNHSKGGTREQRIQASQMRLLDKISLLEEEIVSLKKDKLSNSLELERLRDEKRGRGLGWERDAEGRDSLTLTPQQNMTLRSIFLPAESVEIDRDDEKWTTVVLYGDQRVKDNSEKAIARMNGIPWVRLMQLEKQGLVKDIYEDDEALFMSIPLEIARIFHYVEGDE